MLESFASCNSHLAYYLRQMIAPKSTQHNVRISRVYADSRFKCHCEKPAAWYLTIKGEKKMDDVEEEMHEHTWEYKTCGDVCICEWYECECGARK